MLQEKDIRRIVQDEMKKGAKASRFGLKNTQFHTHNGVDAPKVRTEDLYTNPGVMGNVNFSSSGVDYTFHLNLPQTPKQVILNGIFVNSLSAPTVRYHVWGMAYLGQTYYLQPLDNRNVEVGGVPYPAPDNLQDGSTATIPAQSSSFFGFVNGANAGTAGTSQFHIADVFGSATLRVTVVDFSKDKIVFRVTSLSSGYTLAANYFIIWKPTPH